MFEVDVKVVEVAFAVLPMFINFLMETGEDHSYLHVLHDSDASSYQCLGVV